MESGAIIGIFAGVGVVASTEAVIVRYFSKQPTWGSALKHVAMEAAVGLGGIGVALILIDMFSAVDSSHGFMAIGIPIFTSAVSFMVALLVFLGKAAASAYRRHK